MRTPMAAIQVCEVMHEWGALAARLIFKFHYLTCEATSDGSIMSGYLREQWLTSSGLPTSPYFHGRHRTIFENKNNVYLPAGFRLHEDGSTIIKDKP